MLNSGRESCVGVSDIHTYIHTYIHTHIYTHAAGEREREKGLKGGRRREATYLATYHINDTFYQFRELAEVFSQTFEITGKALTCPCRQKERERRIGQIDGYGERMVDGWVYE